MINAQQYQADPLDLPYIWHVASHVHSKTSVPCDIFASVHGTETSEQLLRDCIQSDFRSAYSATPTPALTAQYLPLP